MPTARSSPDPVGPSGVTSSAGGASRGPARPPGPARSLVPLLQLRLAVLAPRARLGLVLGAGLLVLVTVAAAVLPAFVPVPSELHERLRTSLPAAVLGFLLTATIAGVASAGGREMVPADQAVAFPLGTTTDHLASLLLAPLNLAWIVQAWALLAAVAAVSGPERIWAAQLPVVLWVAAATSVAQVLSWLIEIVRLHRGGAWVVRAVALVLGAALLGLAARGHLLAWATSLGGGSVVELSRAGAAGQWGSWLVGLLVLALLTGAAVPLGAVAARRAGRRPPRVQTSVETRSHPPRRDPAGVLRALVRIDRASVWRSAPLRRGIVLLAVLPMLVALAGRLEWAVVPVLPGLAASGGALLFGVNAWCLDARGAVWRESLPVSPRHTLLARAWVLTEMLVVAELATVVVSGARAGVPTAAELAATLAAAAVVSLRVVASSLRWSVRRPFGVDLRRARATPAPPAVMVGYSARLSVMATLTGLLFSTLGQVAPWTWSVGAGAVLGLTSLASLRRTVRRWETPAVRARVVATVSNV